MQLDLRQLPEPSPPPKKEPPDDPEKPRCSGTRAGSHRTLSNLSARATRLLTLLVFSGYIGLLMRR